MSTSDIVTLFLPVVWAIVATIIGILLYKTSSALFESEKHKDGHIKRVRLVGSVVIAGGAFFAMKTATPESRLISHSLVDTEEGTLSQLVDSADRLTSIALEISACVEVTDFQECRRKSEELLVLTKVHSGKLASLRKTIGKP